MVQRRVGILCMAGLRGGDRSQLAIGEGMMPQITNYFFRAPNEVSQTVDEIINSMCYLLLLSAPSQKCMCHNSNRMLMPISEPMWGLTSHAMFPDVARVPGRGIGNIGAGGRWRMGEDGLVGKGTRSTNTHTHFSCDALLLRETDVSRSVPYSSWEAGTWRGDVGKTLASF